MVLSCDLTIDGKSDQEFVLLRKAIYLLPDKSLAGVLPTLIWCDSWAFSDGEALQSESELRTQLHDVTTGNLSASDAFLFDTNDKMQRFARKLERSLHFLSLRETPPKCLHCGSESIDSVPSVLHTEFTDKLGRKVSYSQSFASTSIDHWLYAYDLDGRLVGEISRVCPETNDFIDDEYSFEKLVTLIDAGNSAG